MNLNTKSIMIVLLAFILLPLANAQILVSTSVDKDVFYENEVGMLTIKVVNDRPEELANVMLRIEGDEGIRFIDNFDEKIIIVEETGSIRSGGSKEIFVKIKVISALEPQPKIFVYYGENETPQNASVTFVNTKESLVSVKTNAKRINSEEGEKIVVDFSIANYSKLEIKGVGAEVITPKNYIIRTPPFFAQTISDNNSQAIQFELLPPPEAVGAQKIVLSYAYTDEFGGHYFEEVFEVNIERTNQLVFAVLGVAILVIAGYLYIQKDRKGSEDNAVKGTGN